MSTKSFVLDYGLPGLAALGVGLFSYMLTGGPEEYPEPSPETEQPDIDRDTEYDDEDHKLDIPNQVTVPALPPPWVQKIVEQNQLIAEELRLLKEAAQHQAEQQSLQFRQLQAQYQSTAAKAVCEECKVKNKTETPVEAQAEASSDKSKVATPAQKDWSLLLRLAVWNMANPVEGLNIVVDSEEALLSSTEHCLAKKELTSEQSFDITENASFAAACDMLLMYINNLIKNPTVPRYRRVSTTNNSYMKSLSAVQGHDALLSAVGFVRKAESNHFEYEWHSLPSSTADTNSPINSSKIDSNEKPGSAQEAAALLAEAVTLLTALKTSVRKLATVLQEKLTAVALAPGTDTPAAAGDITKTSAATAIEHANSNGSIKLLAALESPASQNIDAAEESLISVSVVEVSEQDGISGGDEAAAAVDFMQILKRAQESKGKST